MCWPSPEGGELADERDLYYCYRLLMGRDPDATGWRYYRSLIKTGWTVQDLVHSFLTSSEFQERVAPPVEHGPHALVRVAQGFEMYVSPNDWVVGRQIHETGSYEPHVTATLTRHLKPGATFLDIGANVGYFSLLAANQLGPEGKVIACEPNPYCCALLLASCRHNGFTNLDLYPFAISERFALHQLETSDTNGELMSLPDRLDEMLSRRLVFAAPLDWLPHERRIDAMKLDIEGAEYLALCGGTELLRRDRPVIISEFSPPRLQRVSGVTAERYAEFLIGAGYRISCLTAIGTDDGFTDDARRVAGWMERMDHDHIDILAVPSDTIH
jgi:FkbM family methyltransferase